MISDKYIEHKMKGRELKTMGSWGLLLGASQHREHSFELSQACPTLQMILDLTFQHQIGLVPVCQRVDHCYFLPINIQKSSKH